MLEQLQDIGLFTDSKSRLQEYVQTLGNGELCYDLIRTEGPDHRKQYTVQVVLGGERLETGTGSSKKSAEQEAATKTLRLLTQR